MAGFRELKIDIPKIVVELINTYIRPMVFYFRKMPIPFQFFYQFHFMKQFWIFSISLYK